MYLHESRAICKQGLMHKSKERISWDLSVPSGTESSIVAERLYHIDLHVRSMQLCPEVQEGFLHPRSSTDRSLYQ